MLLPKHNLGTSFNYQLQRCNVIIHQNSTSKLRRKRDDREEEIRREVKADMEQEIEAIMAKYRELRNQRLEENDQKYRRDVEDLELEEERSERNEQQERHQRRDRHSRGEETRFNSRQQR